MKDINKLKNYRLKYKRYYGIEFSSDYSIHHIDLNHNNNDINNLLLLPKELHNRYHFYLSMLTNFKIEELFKITSNIICNNTYYTNILEDFIPVIKECKKWCDYKMYLDGYLPNIHNIKLEDLL